MTQNNLSDNELLAMTPHEFRSIVREGRYVGTTEGVCQGYAQANLAAVPKEAAFDFLLFCIRNPRPCPVLDVTELGNPHPRIIAPGADLRVDIPRYRVYENGGLIAEPTDVIGYWRDDLVAFLLGCSIGFDWSLKAANIQYRDIGVYTTSIRCIPVGQFRGPVVVSARVFSSAHDAVRAVQITSRLPASHGAPIHIGDPATIGIKDFYHPDVPAEPVNPLQPNEVVLFWGCGITPQAVAIEAKLPFMITHYPVNMFVTDKLTEELAVL